VVPVVSGTAATILTAPWGAFADDLGSLGVHTGVEALPPLQVRRDPQRQRQREQHALSNLPSFAQQGSGLTGVHLTLPVDDCGSDPQGEWVNIVDLPLIQSTVGPLIKGLAAGPARRRRHQGGR
jgi:hypothetical protein